MFLENICNSETTDPTMLYASVLEAQRTGNQMQTIQSMQKVLHKYDYGAPKGVNLAALLR